jgi:hypothetical protein
MLLRPPFCSGDKKAKHFRNFWVMGSQCVQPSSSFTGYVATLDGQGLQGSDYNLQLQENAAHGCRLGPNIYKLRFWELTNRIKRAMTSPERFPSPLQKLYIQKEFRVIKLWKHGSYLQKKKKI